MLRQDLEDLLLNLASLDFTPAAHWHSKLQTLLSRHAQLANHTRAVIACQFSNVVSVHFTTAAHELRTRQPTCSFLEVSALPHE